MRPSYIAAPWRSRYVRNALRLKDCVLCAALRAGDDRKAHVLATFDGLAEGESLVVVNVHMPNGLLRHFEEQRPGAFGWTPLESGPEVFRVEIAKTR